MATSKPKVKAQPKQTEAETEQRFTKKQKILGILGAALLIILIAAGYLFLYEPSYSGSVQRTSDKPLIFAHRGFGTHGPDNSLAGSVKAIEQGFDGVDVDGQLTTDGKIVIFHDLSLDRLTDAQGKVANKTLAEMTALDLAKKYEGEGYASAPVASFEDFVKAITPNGILMVELKVSKTGDTGIEREAIRIIEKYNAFDKVYLSSFNPLVIKRLEGLQPKVKTVYIFMDTNWNAELLAEMKPEDVVNLPWFLQKEPIRRGFRKIVKPDMLSVNVAVSEETRARLTQKGWPILLWAPNDSQSITNTIAQNPYGIISDEPFKVQELLGNNQ